MNKRFMLVLGAIVIGLGLIFWFSKDKSNTSGTAANTSSHVYGQGKSGVVLIEYGDFQCPACKSYFPIIKQIKDKYIKEITFQFINFPLPSHKNAFAAHRAAEAADAQGKFWEMHDLLYGNQSSWEASSSPYSIFESFAQSLGIDPAKFKTDFESIKVNNIINADKKAGQKLGVDATPTFYLDGKKLDPSPTSLDAFSKLIDQAIKAKN